MKRTLQIALFLVMILGMFTGLWADLITIGTGTSSSYEPIASYYGYHRSAAIYTDAEIGGTGLINSISYKAQNTNSASIPFKVYISTTTASVLTPAQNWATLTTSLSPVYEGTFSGTTAGAWKTITLTTPYNYTGSNLLVLVECNYGGSGTSGPQWHYSTATNRNQYIRQDTTIPTSSGTVNSNRPNIQLDMSGYNAFAPVFAVNPDTVDFGQVEKNTTSAYTNLTISNNGGSILNITSAELGGADAARFILDMNNNPLPWAIPGGQSVIVKVAFNPLTAITYNAYLRFTGDAKADHDVSLSGTGLDISLNPPFTQDFTAFPPAYWTRWSGLLADPSVLSSTTSGWVADGFANVGSTGAARVNIYGTSAKYWLVTPPINVTPDMQLKFDLALTAFAATTAPTGTQIDDRFAVIISYDNGATWTSANTLRLWDNAGSPYVYNNISTTGETVTIALPAYTGAIKLALYGESTVTSNGDNDLFIDNVTIEPVPTSPIFAITPDSKDWGQVNLNTTVTQIFTISNNGSGTLNLSEIEIIDNPENQFAFLANPEIVPLGTLESLSFTVKFSPTSEGLKTATLKVVDTLSKAEHLIPLSGSGFDSTINDFPYLMDFEALSSLPVGWTKIVQTGNDITINGNPSYNHSPEGTKSLRFSSYNESTDYNQYLFTAPITVTAPYTHLSFWHKMYTSGVETLEWGIGTTTNPDHYSWTEIDLDWNNFQETTIDLSAYVGQTVYLGFHYYGDYAYYVYVDDLSITQSFDYTEGIEVPITIGTVNVTGGNANNVPAGTVPEVPNAGFVPEYSTVMQLLGAGPWTISFTTTQPWGAWYSYTSAAWMVVENLGGTITFVIPAGGKDIPEVPMIFGPVDPTLPVELSSFSAILTAGNFVKLSWITESETNMLGYRVYRSETADYAAAALITPVMIEATNSSTQQTYSLTDSEVSINSTYYYWLEAVDMSHSVLYGPNPVLVTGGDTPNLPSVTSLGNAYPNPFRTQTSIGLSVKENETATVTIYNILGQVVKTYRKGQGSHTINWDGRDARGNACGSGIYFYKLSSPSMNQTKKMIIVK